MSLCIAMNNPGNFVVIAGDGRTTKSGVIVQEDHPKITMLTKNVAMFSSGIQDAAEELRSTVKGKINEDSPIEMITKIVQQESIKLHSKLLDKIPELKEVCLSGGTTIATVLGFFDNETNTSGYVEFSHVNEFLPMIHTGPEVKTRGKGQDYALETILNNHSKSMNPVENVFNTYRTVTCEEPQVGGVITVFYIGKQGTMQYQEQSVIRIPKGGMN